MGARRIGIVSVGRSDAGHLSPLFKLLPDAQRFWYQAKPVSTPADVAEGYGLAVGNFAHQFRYQEPVDLVVIFGDRWEQHAAATAAHLMNLPIVHLHAGERTEAVVDDALRGSISVMARWLVAAAPGYAMNLKRQGYHNVVTLGAPGLARLKPAEPRQGMPYIAYAFHPETKNLARVASHVKELDAALAEFTDTCIITGSGPGLDAGRDDIRAWCGDGLTRTDEEWVTMLSHVDVLVGNSSCGIIEAPSVPLPTVNIGDRQKGRLRAPSVIDTPHDRHAIRAAIALALNPEWRMQHLTGENPYGDRHAAERIAEFLTTCAI